MRARLRLAAVVVSVAFGLVAATASAQTVSFASPSSLSTGFSPGAVAVADFTGTGASDIAVLDPGGSSVSVYVPNGSGGYTADGPFAVEGTPESLAIADFNGDGMPDIVTADGLGTSVSVLMNTTTKGASTVTFASHHDFTVGSYPDAIAIADINGDGKPDIATANNGTSNVSVLLNTTTKDSPTASFATAADKDVAEAPTSIAAGDLNGDGKPDIVTGTQFSSPSLSVLLNTTDTDATTASFATAQPIPYSNTGGPDTISGSPAALAIGDLGGADEPGLVVGYNNESYAGVLADETAAHGSTVAFATEQDFGVQDPTSLGVVLADLTGERKLDIVDASNAGPTSVLVNTTPAGASALSFGPYAGFSSVDPLSSVAVGDLNGDGRPDIVTDTGGGTTNNIAILLNRTTSLTTSAPSSGFVGTALGDTAALTAGTLSGGSITFKAYGPNDATCSAAPAFTSAPVAVSGSGSYRSGAFAPERTGTYRWIATYSGDAIDAGTATACGEPVIVSLPPLPRDVTAPLITGKTKKGSTLTCGTGTWSGSPTGYIYRWSRDGTPIVGATSHTYKVQTADEGSQLTCSVRATNPGGASAAVTTKAVKVPIPFVLHCPAASGRLSGTTLGLLRLGMTPAQAHRAYPDSSGRHQRFLDFFCLTPFGVRVGYASPKLLKTLPASERGAYTGRVIWASTSSPVYDVRGVRPGATLANARKQLPGGNLLRVGKNDWYLAPAGAATAVLKVRQGVVQEIGIGAKALTRTRAAQFVFMTSFE